MTAHLREGNGTTCEMIKVSLRFCENYEIDNVTECLRKSIADLGGFVPYINPGERVLLKVNLLMKKKPEEASTTHPAFVQALVVLLQEYGAKVIIADSPGGPFTKSMLKGIYKATGMEAVAEATGAELNRNTESVEREVPNALLLRKMTVTDYLNDVDKVISVSKLKTHGMMTFTGAVKNLFGIIPGLKKAEYHMNLPKHDDFADALIDVCLCANPVLSFMDGIIGMEGAGPSAGEPRAVNCILAGTSPYHLDKVAVSIINLPQGDVPTIRRSVARGLCVEGISDVELVGGRVEDFLVKDFDVPKTKEIMSLKMPKWLKRFFSKILQPRPVFDKKTCNGCADCKKLCPAKIIEMQDNRPVIDLDACIRCFCCQELCPRKAITIYRPFLLRRLSKHK